MVKDNCVGNVSMLEAQMRVDAFYLLAKSVLEGTTKGKIKKSCSERKQQRHNVNIDYSKLTDSIVNAVEIIKEREVQEKAEREKREEEEWNKILHYKECPHKNNWGLRFCYEVRNTITLIWAAFFFKKENAKKPRVTFNLIRLLLGMFFRICEWVMYVLAFGIVYRNPQSEEFVLSIMYVTAL